jgi:hypothetical protein
MATEEQARLARDTHQDRLAASGAHSLSVEPLAASRAGEFGVIAWVDSQSPNSTTAFPSSLSIQEKGRRVAVPLVVRESKPFQVE